MMAQNDLAVVGIDVAKDKVDVCVRALALRQTWMNRPAMSSFDPERIAASQRTSRPDEMISGGRNLDCSRETSGFRMIAARVCFWRKRP
jgi:hypothetical protein